MILLLSAALAASPSVSGSYDVAVDLSLSRPYLVPARANQEARVTELRVALRADCAGAGPVTCSLHGVTLEGEPYNERADKLAAVLDEAATDLSAATVTLEFDHGRLAGLKLDGVPRPDRRQSRRAELLRQVLLRAFAGFDLQAGEGAEWTQTSSALLDYPDPSGTVHTGQLVQTRDEAGVFTRGEASLRPTPNDDVFAADSWFTGVVEATATFAGDRLTSRTWKVTMDPTPSGIPTSLGPLDPYGQTGSIRAVD